MVAYNMNDKFYKEILNSLQDGIYYLDRDRVITYWNRGAEQISGYSADQVIGKSCHDNLLNHVTDKGLELCKDHCPMAATMLDGKPRKAYLYLHHADGHRVPVQIQSAAIHDENGSIIGAVETFSKGVSPENTERRIRKLQQTALLDPLTTIGNRRHLESRLKINMMEYHENKFPFGLLFCDIDHFKDINDTFGHNIGDKVLQMVSQTLRGNIRETDMLGRWGGEEFLVILQNIDVASLFKIGEKLIHLVRQSHLFSPDGHIVSVTISVGGTLVNRADTIDSLVDRADRLMYQSKANGRNRITIG